MSGSCDLGTSRWRRWRWLQPLSYLLAAVAAAVALRLAVQWQLPLPTCWMRKFTGVPCPGCGCTRSILAWTYGNIGEALRLNPLFFSLCLVLACWVAVWSLERLTGRRWIASWQTHAQRWPVWRTLAVLAVVNWIYLILTLPK